MQHEQQRRRSVRMIDQFFHGRCVSMTIDSIKYLQMSRKRMMDYPALYPRSYPRGPIEIIHYVNPLIMYMYSAVHSTHLAFIFLHRSHDRHHIAYPSVRASHEVSSLSFESTEVLPLPLLYVRNIPLCCAAIYCDSIVYFVNTHRVCIHGFAVVPTSINGSTGSIYPYLSWFLHGS